MDLEMIILSQIPYDITDRWNLIFFNYTNELMYKPETELQMLKNKLMVTKEEMWGEGQDKLGAGDEHTHTCSVTQSCPALCDPVDCSSPGSSVHGILQARILQWVAIPFSRGSSQPRDGT